MNTNKVSEQGQAAVGMLVFILLLFLVVVAIMSYWNVIFATVQCTGPLCQG